MKTKNTIKHDALTLNLNSNSLFSMFFLLQTIGAAFGAKKVDIGGKQITLGIWVRISDSFIYMDIIMIYDVANISFTHVFLFSESKSGHQNWFSRNNPNSFYLEMKLSVRVLL